MYFSSIVARRMIPCALVGVFALGMCESSRAGIVNVVSQDSYIDVTGSDATGTPVDENKHSAGLEGFSATLTYTHPEDGLSSKVTQDSAFTPTGNGGETFTSSATGNYDEFGSTHSSFQVVFDLTAPATYALAYTDGVGRGGAAAISLAGPSGATQIPPVVASPIDGSLVPGRYTLTAAAGDGSSYDLRVDISPTTTAVPLPPAFLTGSMTMAVLWAGFVVHGRRGSSVAKR